MYMHISSGSGTLVCEFFVFDYLNKLLSAVQLYTFFYFYYFTTERTSFFLNKTTEKKIIKLLFHYPQYLFKGLIFRFGHVNSYKYSTRDTPKCKYKHGVIHTEESNAVLEVLEKTRKRRKNERQMRLNIHSVLWFVHFCMKTKLNKYV